MSQFVPALLPPLLAPGDTVRFVSPASTPNREGVLRRAKVLADWGLRVEFGSHAFDKLSFLAGRDEDRLADINEALRAEHVRAVFATRGGKGSYRIADGIDFAAVRRDPKLLVGFSDITMLHLMLWKECRLVGVHGALLGDEEDRISEVGAKSLRSIIIDGGAIVLRSDPTALTAQLTSSGTAFGPLVGGNLDMVATAAGWALPNLDGAILLLEAVRMELGQVDRQLTMLVKSGLLDGLAGIALGHFTGFRDNPPWTVVDLLRHHLAPLGVAILGGLPIGHDADARSLPIGAPAALDAEEGVLSIAAWRKHRQA